MSLNEKCYYYAASFGSSSEKFTADVQKSYWITAPSIPGTYLIMISNLVNESLPIYDMSIIVDSNAARSYIGSATRAISVPICRIATLSANQSVQVSVKVASTTTSYLSGAVLFFRLK